MQLLNRDLLRQGPCGWVCCLAVLLGLWAIILLSQAAEAQNGGTVRGRIMWQRGSGTYPAAYLRVTLAVPDDETQSADSYTDARGFYYFYGIPPSDYILKIWYRGSNNAPGFYRIRVFNRPITDVRTIVLSGRSSQRDGTRSDQSAFGQQHYNDPILPTFV